MIYLGDNPVGLNQNVHFDGQDEAAFMGLALAAGDTTQINSSNSVGEYTDEAKIKIQKMLGIYEAPFRLIREYVVPEDSARVTIDVDSDGESFNLKEIIVKLVAKQTNGTGNGGLIMNGISVENNTPFITTYNTFRSDSDCTTYAHGKVIGGRFFGECGQSSMTSIWSPSNFQRNPNSAGIIEVETITSITYKSLNNYTVKAGTTILIYGR